MGEHAAPAALAQYVGAHLGASSSVGAGRHTSAPGTMPPMNQGGAAHASDPHRGQPGLKQFLEAFKDDPSLLKSVAGIQAGIPGIPGLRPIPGLGGAGAPGGVGASSSLLRTTTIRCVCGDGRDQGDMVQCEGCGCWQHAGCVGLPAGPPGQVRKVESFHCERCRAERVDPFWEVVTADLLTPPAKLKPNGRYASVRGGWGSLEGGILGGIWWGVGFDGVLGFGGVRLEDEGSGFDGAGGRDDL